jgi:hypothetical protein
MYIFQYLIPFHKTNPSVVKHTNLLRIRRIRCDETKPSCSRCTSTGRLCDFVKPQKDISSARASRPPENAKQRLAPSGRQYLLQPKPSFPPSALSSAHEGNHLEYFRFVCTRSFSRYFENTLWSKTILQIANSEPSIRSAVVAFSALLRHQTAYGHSCSVVMKKEISLNYFEAIRSLNSRLDSSQSCWELALIVSLLFAAFETFQCNDRLALKHFEAGLAVLQEYKPTAHV